MTDHDSANQLLAVGRRRAPDTTVAEAAGLRFADQTGARSGSFPRDFPGADKPVARTADPGLVEALAYLGDRGDRLESRLADLLARVAILEGKLAPLLRQAPPYGRVASDPAPGGPASDVSSVLAQQLVSAAHRTDRHADELGDLADRLEHLTALVDLS